MADKKPPTSDEMMKSLEGKLDASHAKIKSLYAVSTMTINDPAFKEALSNYNKIIKQIFDLKTIIAGN